MGYGGCMDATTLNGSVLGIVGLVVFFYLLHVTVRSAVRRGIADARADVGGGESAGTSDGP